jgi:hypothetical protein
VQPRTDLVRVTAEVVESRQDGEALEPEYPF